MLKHTHKLAVCKKIQLFYILSLHIDAAGVTKYIYKAGLVHFHINPFCSQPDITKQTTQFTGALGKSFCLLDCKFIECIDLAVKIIHIVVISDIKQM